MRPVVNLRTEAPEHPMLPSHPLPYTPILSRKLPRTSWPWVAFSPDPNGAAAPVGTGVKNKEGPGPRYAASGPLRRCRLRSAFLYPFDLGRTLKSRLLHLLKLLQYSDTLKEHDFFCCLMVFKFAAPLWSLNYFSFLKIIQSFFFFFCIKLLILSQSGNTQELQNTLLGDLVLYVFILHQPVSSPPLICWLPSLFAVSFLPPRASHGNQ